MAKKQHPLIRKALTPEVLPKDAPLGDPFAPGPTDFTLSLTAFPARVKKKRIPPKRLAAPAKKR
jgi:hypothetical protein